MFHCIKMKDVEKSPQTKFGIDIFPLDSYLTFFFLAATHKVYTFDKTVCTRIIGTKKEKQLFFQLKLDRLPPFSFPYSFIFTF